MENMKINQLALVKITFYRIGQFLPLLLALAILAEIKFTQKLFQRRLTYFKDLKKCPETTLGF